MNTQNYFISIFHASLHYFKFNTLINIFTGANDEHWNKAIFARKDVSG